MQKFTPLQKISLQYNNTANVSLADELSAGIKALDIVKTQPSVFKMVQLYAILVAEIQLKKVNMSMVSSKEMEEFDNLNKRLFALAHKMNIFLDVQVLCAGIIQAIEYISKYPQGEDIGLATSLIQGLNSDSGYGDAGEMPALTQSQYSALANPILYIATFLIVLKLIL